MAVDSTSPLTTLPSDAFTQSQKTTGPNSFGSKNDFLKLFVAQLQNQNPLDPQKGADFVAQLAQFSSLEQQTQTNQGISSLLDSQAGAQRASMATLVGRTVTAKVSSLDLAVPLSSPPGLGVHLDAAAKSVKVTVTDAAGKTVRTIDLGARAAGDLDTGWNGLGDNGAALPVGKYQIAITAKGADGKDVSSYATLKAPISALDFGQSGTSFRVGAANITPGDIVAVQQ